MSDVEITLIKNKKNHRTHSDFLCREMFYEHMAGKIDQDRRRSVDLLIGSSPELKNEYRSLLTGLKYAEDLRQIEIAAGVLNNMVDDSSRVKRWLLKLHWRKWPAPLRWSFQGLIVAAVTAYGVGNFPWQKLPVVTQLFNPQSVELARIENSQQPAEEVPGLFPQDSIENVGEADEQTMEEVAVGVTEESDEAQAAAQKRIEEAEEEKTEDTSSLAAAAEDDDNKAALKGFVYRSYPLMTHLDERAPVIAEKIKELGGSRAGKVELGWRRQNSRYFHFSLPEKNYDELIHFLESFATIKVIKDRHRRVMPEGYIRFILWIEEVPEKSADQ